MGWAGKHFEALVRGEAVEFRPTGGSMRGRINSGQLCCGVPVDATALQVGDIVLCRVHAKEYLHLIKAIDGRLFQIGNNRGSINGWIDAKSIYGKCVSVQD